MNPGVPFLFLAAAAIVAAAVIFRTYRRDMALAADLARRGSRTACTAAGPIEYADAGIGVPLLSVHGSGGGHDQGLATVSGLLGDGFRIIAPSRFGYLGTPLPADTSVAAQADAHAALLDALGVERAIVVGASAGARSALEFAIRHPGRLTSLILIVPATFAPATAVAIEGSRTSAFVLRLVEAGADFGWWSLAKVAPSILLRFLGVQPELLVDAPQPEKERVRRIIRMVEPLSLRAAGIGIDGRPDPRRPRLEDVGAPTLVISAQDDLFNTLPSAAFAASAIPDAKLIVYETGGHLLVGRQRELRKAIADHIGGHR
ncbi:MAG: alpha/beta fold hydrolase [Pseudomonadota bacterium]